LFLARSGCRGIRRAAVEFDKVGTTTAPPTGNSWIFCSRIRVAHDRVRGSIDNGSVRDLDDVRQIHQMMMGFRNE
jgi:hypothetical protein